jgi:Protein of unknown function (DUF1091)
MRFPFQLYFKVSKKEKSQYKVLMDNGPTDWCKLVSGNSKGYFFIKIVLESLKKYVPNIFHKCQYVGNCSPKLNRFYFP